jgi:uncharacterized protein involved in outer membrane biogenesis
VRVLGIVGAVILLLLGGYTTAGFVLVPRLVAEEAEAFVARTLQRDLAIHHVAFNPFSFTLELQQVDLRERDGARLVNVSAVLARLRPLALLQREVALERLRIEAPWIHAGRDAAGELNLARLAADAATGTDDAEPEGVPATPWYVTLEHFELLGGVLHLTDRSDPTYAEAYVMPVDLELAGLTTRPGREGPSEVVIGFRDGGQVILTGELGLDPLVAQGTVIFQDYAPLVAWRFLRDELDLSPPRGRLSGSASYRFDVGERGAGVVVDDVQFELRGLALQRASIDHPLVDLERIQVADGRFELDGNRIRIGALGLSGGGLYAVRQAAAIDWAGIVAGDFGQSAEPQASAAAPWQLDLGAVAVRDVSLRYEDRDTVTPLHVEIADVGVDFSLRGGRDDEGVSLVVDGLGVELQGITSGPVGRESLIELDRARLSGGEIDVAAGRVALGELRVEGGSTRLRRDLAGTTNWERALARRGAGTQDVSGADDDAPAWQLELARTEVGGLVLELANETPNGVVAIRVDPARLTLANLSWPPRAPVNLDAGFQVVEGGEIRVTGEVEPRVPAAAVELAVQALALSPFRPYVAALGRVALDSGSASAALAVDFGKAADGVLRVDGAAGLDGLRVVETETGETLLGWRGLDVEQLTFASDTGRFHVSEMVLDRPEGKFLIFPDTSNNWQRALGGGAGDGADAPADASDPSGDAAGPARVAEIGRIRVRDGALKFGDLSLPTPFEADIDGLNGSIAGLSSAQDARASVELEGQVDDYGSASIGGQIAPLDPTGFTDIEMAFRNIDLSHLTPYSAKFAGYRIRDGKLSLDLGYRVEQSQLQGDNRIVVERLTLGEKVESPDAIDAPLELAIALLEDARGRIDLGLPVSGNLDDPQFSYGHLVWKAVGNLIAKVVTAPFRALGAALGVKGEDLDTVGFRPGSSDLPPPQREKLESVVRILSERPKLGLEVRGAYAPDADGRALRETALRAELLRRQGVVLAPGERPGPVSLTDPDSRKALEALVAERLGADRLAELAVAAKSGEKKAPDPAVYDSLYADLRAAWPLPAAALERLASARADAVVGWLTAEGGLRAARLGAVTVGAATDRHDAEAGRDVTGAVLELTAAP